MKFNHTDQTNNPLASPKQYGDTTFKISGTPLEVLQALAYVKALGGGHVRIGMGLLPAKSLYYKGQFSTPEWAGRLNQEDFDIICTLAQNQKWVKSIEPWNGELVDIDFDKVDYTTDMDNRFNMHPMDRFGKVAKVHWTGWQTVRLNSWLDIPAIPGRPTGKGIIFTGTGWEAREVYPHWAQQGIAQASIFLGTDQEYEDFVAVTGMAMDHQPVSHVGELAQWIESMQQIICTPGWGAAIAQALNKRLLVQSLPEVETWRNPYVLSERGNCSTF